MKIEKLNYGENKIWKGFLYGFIVCAILMVVVSLFTSKAKYRTTESIPLVRGKISYKPADLNVVAMYQENESGEYESVDAIPSSGYTLNSTESYCEVNKVKDTNISIEYNNGVIGVDNISKKGTKCYVYFDIILGNTMSEILAGYTQSTRTDFSAVLTTASTGTVYSAEDDLGTSLYFAGAPTDNWVSFGGYFWRIIRMNGDGSTRIIYAGSSPTTTGTDDQLASISTYNDKYGDNAYVGYMYGTAGSTTYDATHANINDSTIKDNLDSWYNTNLNKSGISEYIEGNAGFCNDRSVYSGTGYGGGDTVTDYAAYNRLYTNKAPSLKCTKKSADLFTTSGSSQGNGKLTYPIGLITADEVAYAGGVNGTNNSSYYLYTGQDYWTITPYGYYHEENNISRVDQNGKLGMYWGDYDFGVRPVINLKADTKFTGTGLASNPFQVATE